MGQQAVAKDEPPLDNKQPRNQTRTEGMIYVMYGVDNTSKSLAGEPAPRPRLGIQYDIAVIDGKIAQTSILWMGTLNTLGNRVVVPTKNQVLIDRWFDWRPIPIIQGEAASDPKLLGLPEHLPANDSTLE